jgi:hypothetical protein
MNGKSPELVLAFKSFRESQKNVYSEGIQKMLLEVELFLLGKTVKDSKLNKPDNRTIHENLVREILTK